jgi:hypothetical protein
MSELTDRSHWQEMLEAALKQTTGLRLHALTDSHKRALAALAAACAQRRRSGNATKEEMAKDVVDEVSSRIMTIAKLLPDFMSPTSEEPNVALPQLPKHPLTGEILVPKTPDEEVIFKRHWPQAYEAWRKFKDKPFKALAEFEQAKADAELRANITYGAAQHNPETNPFLGTDTTAQSDFVKAHPKPLVERYQAEAQPLKPLPWQKGGKLTDWGVLSKSAPTEYALAKSAEGILKEWNRIEAAQIEQKRAALTKELAALEPVNQGGTK